MSDKKPPSAPLAYQNEPFLNSPDGRIIRVLSEYMEPLARFMLWVAVAAWALVAAAFLARFVRHPAGPPSAAQAPSSKGAATHDMTTKKDLP